jgi:hypothetical protein
LVRARRERGGTFTYNPAPGIVLPTGTAQKLAVTFMPADTTDYTSVTASNAITVNPAVSQLIDVSSQVTVTTSGLV